MKAIEIFPNGFIKKTNAKYLYEWNQFLISIPIKAKTHKIRVKIYDTEKMLLET